MKCIHVLRKPCSESTVAANVLKFGTGALNIDGCRVATSPADFAKLAAGVEAIRARGGVMENSWKNSSDLSGANPANALGRWPANVILTHAPGCGDECAPGCPVAALDAQSGILLGRGDRISLGHGSGSGVTGWGKGRTDAPPRPELNDAGGASRFFKQFTTLPMNTTSDNMNTDLADYLRALISPEERTLTTTEGGECVYLHVTAPDTFSWGEHGDASVHGLTVESSSLAGQSVWLPEAMRVLKPGGHLLLAAPDEEPTGHTGACIAEDAGFEVRDAILWAYGEGAGDRLHYTAKAARAEREAGLYAEVGEVENEGGKRKNVHPTVKPVSVMARLLGDISKDCGPVVDPFLGSGTTLLACIETGHDGIGIEREREYIEIADARVRHRDYDTAGWNRAHIVSDVAPVSPADGDGAATGEQSLDDFFGL